MKFGVSSSPFVWWRRVEEFNEWICEAENLGYDAIFIPDHYNLPESNELIEAWTTLSYIAAKTSRIKVGTSVSPLPRWLPSQLAKIIATVDLLSNGRVIVGLGAGYVSEEFINYSPQGYLGEPKEMVERFLEGLQLMIKLWTEDKVTFDGRYYRLREATLLPKPIQKPRPPLWSGGLGPRMLKITAKYFDAWFPSRRRPEYSIPEKYGEAVTFIKNYLRKYGRSQNEFTFAIVSRMSKSSSEDINIIDKYLRAGCQYYIVEVPPTPLSPGAKYQLEAIKRFAKEVIPSF
ncbi:MAG: LLM class flavin-dependent oxidoreductase [Candidatus Bathyarchaeia archaeon]|nr:LLM class flavin-dependent oxidoreductase [Candidatus Bathyarchaeota archaeon]